MTSNSKPSLLIVGTYIPGYSFTRVLESLAQQFCHKYSIHWLGLGYRGPEKELSWGLLYPSNLRGGDVFGAYEAATLAEELGIPTILLLTDIYLLKHYADAWQPLKGKGIRLVAYTPLEGPLINVKVVKDITLFDELVLYHRGAVADMENAIDRWRHQENYPDIRLPQLNCCFHGTDTTVFHPPASSDLQRQLKQELFNVPDAAGAVFILNANRYCERKDIPATITAFANARQGFDKPAYLCLHTPGLDERKKNELHTLIINSGCPDQILLNPLGNEYIPDEQLVKLYQACAIGVNTSQGEGWGMISFEHAACGAAQLVPDNSACKELWTGHGLVIPCNRSMQPANCPFELKAVYTDLVADTLIQLVNDEAFATSVSLRCYRYVQSGIFSWKKIAENWKEILAG